MKKLPDESRIGKVSLTITDLDRSIDFYTERLGFRVNERKEGRTVLGVADRDLLELHEMPGAVHPDRTTGLYHFAILVPSRFHLARSLHRIAESRTPVQGFADHLVSEAIYLPDPDGNGIEIYRDRARDDWPRTLDGSIRMDNAPLDIDGIIAELGEDPPAWTGLDAGTRIGHMHLHVAQIEESERFYRDTIGFDLMMRFGPSASFFSAGGYHHHLAVNTWAGRGAPPPPENAVGLRWFEVVLPDVEALDSLSGRLEDAGHSFERTRRVLEVRDPSRNLLHFTTL